MDKYQYLKADHYAFQCLTIESPEDIVKNIRERYQIESDTPMCTLLESKGNDHNEALSAMQSSAQESVKTSKDETLLCGSNESAKPEKVVNAEACLEPRGTLNDIKQHADQPSKVDSERHLQLVTEERRNELNSLKPNASTYTLAHAYQVLRNQNITYDTKFGVFIIKQPKEVARIVSLFPKVNCSCQAVGCHHILAAKINLGMNVGETKPANLTKLRKNGRAKKEKRSGRKRPRPLDMSGMKRILIECL